MRIELYTRVGCHLCDDAKVVIDKVLSRVRSRGDFELAIIDVDSDAALAERYGLEVPVIVVDGRKHAKYRLDERAFEERLLRGASES